jgi:octaprenyl-diphosphate synthase
MAKCIFAGTVTNPMQQQFSEVLVRARATVQAGLDLCQEFIQQVTDEAPGALHARMQEITGRQGKRVRATMMLLVGAMGKPVDADTLRRQARVAASLELLHLASLVHDDVIDESSLRRGSTTPNAKWGNKMAVLVGDYILSKSMELAVQEEDQRIPAILSRASSQLVEGEILEIDLAGKFDAKVADYNAVIEGKTASLFDACGQCGAILAGQNPQMVLACGDLGRRFGLTFQIVDDLLDYGIGAGDLGKAKFSDLANGLATLPILLYFEKSTEDQKATMSERLLDASKGTPGASSEVLAELTQSGVFESTLEIAMDHMHSAIAVLDSLPPSKEKDIMSEVCLSTLHRNH